MALESANDISELVETNPDGQDAGSSLDDHARLIKSAIQASFPDIRYVYFGRATEAGSAVVLPSGWAISGSAGHYIVTHSLCASDYVVVPGVRTGLSRWATADDVSPNSFAVITFSSSGTVSAEFTFAMVLY